MQSKGQDFLDPNFVSVNNTNLRQNRSTIAQRRLLSAFGQATLGFKELPVPDRDRPQRLDLHDPDGEKLLLLSLDFRKLHLLRRDSRRSDGT